MDQIDHWIISKAQEGLLSWADQVSASDKFGVSVATIEGKVLRQGILPARYQRNRNMLSCQDQLNLFSSHVVVVGSGGLGGHVIEGLARLGVGCLTVIDPDRFEEHNLNRQSLSNLDNLGHKKVEVAVAWVGKVNPAVRVVPRFEAFSRNNGIELLSDAQVVVDALDSIEVRLELSEICRKLALPLVHGAIGSWYGQVITQMPDGNSTDTLYARNCSQAGLENELGNPSFTPAVVAAIEVAETCKLLLGRGNLLRQRLLNIDLLDMEFVEVSL